MSYGHFFFLEQLDLIKCKQLLDESIDGLYFILSKNEKYSDIVQYSKKYDNLRVITVYSDNLDKNLELK